MTSQVEIDSLRRHITWLGRLKQVQLQEHTSHPPMAFTDKTRISRIDFRSFYGYLARDGLSIRASHIGTIVNDTLARIPLRTSHNVRTEIARF